MVAEYVIILSINSNFVTLFLRFFVILLFVKEWQTPYKPTKCNVSDCPELFPDVIEWEHQQEQAERSYFLDNLLTYENPKNDNEKLCNLQAEFLRTHSKKAEAQLWTTCLEVVHKFINLEQKEKHFFMNEEDKQDKAIEAVEYVMRRYMRHYKTQRDKGRMDTQFWAGRTSFLNALYGGVKHALYYEGGQKETVKIDYVGTITDALQYKVDKDGNECC
jgi:hypothetical protein